MNTMLNFPWYWKEKAYSSHTSLCKAKGTGWKDLNVTLNSKNISTYYKQINLRDLMIEKTSTSTICDSCQEPEKQGD